MIILFECPKAVIFEPSFINGANLISRLFFNLSLHVKKITFIYVTDAQKKECLTLKKLLCKESQHHFCHYHDLKDLIESNSLIPTAAFISDISIDRMLQFKNINGYSFPVIGLIHSLGTPSSFQKLDSIFPLMKSNDSFICPSHHTKETLTKYGCPDNQSRVIHFGYNEKKFFPLPSGKKELRKKLHLPQQKTIMLLLTRLTPCLKMDFTPLIRLLPELIQDNPKLILYIVGSVTDKHYVAQLKKHVIDSGLSKHVIWCTKPKQKNIEKYYQASDFFISLSDAAGETYGLTITEAMACGLPVILSDFSGYRMHITNEQEGYYIPTLSGSIDLEKEFHYFDLAHFGDSYAQSIALDKTTLKKRILDVSKSKLLRKKMGKAAQETAKTRNNLLVSFNHYANFFKQQSMVPCEDISLKPKKITLHKRLNHSTTSLLSLQDTFTLSASYRYALETNSDVMMFKKHIDRFPHIPIISTILLNKDYSLKQLMSSLNLSRSDIEKTLLYLLKHFFVEII